MSQLYQLLVSDLYYPVDKEGNILSLQEAQDSEHVYRQLQFYTVPPGDFLTIDERDYWRRDIWAPNTGLLLPSLWLPDLNIYLSEFRHLVQPDGKSLTCPAIFGQVRIMQVTTDRYAPVSKLDQEIQRQVDGRLKEITSQDFPRIMRFMYTLEAADVFSAAMKDSREILMEVPVIPEVPKSGSLKERIQAMVRSAFSQDPHKRGIPENFRVGRVAIEAIGGNFLRAHNQ